MGRQIHKKCVGEICAKQARVEARSGWLIVVNDDDVVLRVCLKCDWIKVNDDMEQMGCACIHMYVWYKMCFIKVYVTFI